MTTSMPVATRLTVTPAPGGALRWRVTCRRCGASPWVDAPAWEASGEVLGRLVVRHDQTSVGCHGLDLTALSAAVYFGGDR